MNTRLRRSIRTIGAVLSGVVLAAMGACSRSPAAAAGGGGAKVRVVCTTGMIADAARNIGGAHVDVVQLMGAGVDPHLYRASPGDIREVRQAKVVLHNGLHLEGRMGEVLTNPGAGVVSVAVGERIEEGKLMRPPEFEGQHDPHVWFDVSLWKEAVAGARDALVKADAAHAADYERNTAAYLAKLDVLHAWCRDELALVSAERRVLITAHDAFGYFGRAYGVEVRAIQGVSTESEAGVSDINALVDLIVARKIPAVFVESSVPAKFINALVEGCASRGHTVAIGGELFSDAMGESGTPEGTYEGMVRHNVNTIVKALSKGGTP